jgi:hypothetical protein
VTKALRAKFIYNNSVHNITNMSPFFAMYDFYLNVSSLIRDDRSEREILIARKKIKEFNNKGKELIKQ